MSKACKRSEIVSSAFGVPITQACEGCGLVGKYFFVLLINCVAVPIKKLKYITLIF